MTYGDEIRRMTNEELAEYMAKIIFINSCECGDSQQVACKEHGLMPEGGCVACLKEDLIWLLGREKNEIN